MEASFHSRLCSKHFIGGQKTRYSLPQIFPWQKHPANTECPSTSTHSSLRLSPSNNVNHDHSYCLTQVPSTHLTPLIDHSISLSSSTVNVGTQTSASYFCIEQIADNDAAIHFYSGFSDYSMLIICFEFLGKSVYHLKYWGSKSKVPSMEKRGTSRSLMHSLK